MPTCRKPGPCEWCGETIDAGTTYAPQLWHTDTGAPRTVRLHAECAAFTGAMDTCECGCGGVIKQAQDDEDPCWSWDCVRGGHRWHYATEPTSPPAEQKEV